MPFPMPGRMAPVHNQTTLQESKLSEGIGWDDEIHFNTQLSSQWDSLVHWQHQPSGLAYNGVTVTKEALAAPHTAANEMPTLDHWHAGGGLVTRGILIDFKAWAEERARAEGKTGAEAVCHPLDGHRVTVEQIEAIARDQGVELRPGDVLVLRTGLTEVLQAPTPDDFAKLQLGKISGVHGTVESAKWLWNQHFAAVAGDAWAFEALMPLKEDGSVGSPTDLGKLLTALDIYTLTCLTPPCPKRVSSTLRFIRGHGMLTDGYSFAPLVAVDVWNAYRRAMGRQSSLGTLQEVRQI